MGDSGRRRPPLRGDKERMDVKPRRKSPETMKRDSEDQRDTSRDDVLEGSMKDIDKVISILMDSSSLDSEAFEINVRDALECFEELNSPNEKRHFLVTTFTLSLDDREFARSAVALYGVMHTSKIGDDTVRSFLLSSIQKELEDNDFRSGNRQRFLNAVFFLSELYYHIRFDDQPISVLGGELLKYFRWLLTGEEKELEVLATCIIVNGLFLKKDKPASYRKLLLEIRTTLVTRNLSPQSRSWLLLVVDMDNVNFDCLPEELLMCHMTMIGDEGFQKFKRVKPTIKPLSSQESTPCNETNTRQATCDKRVSFSNHSSLREPPDSTSERVVSYEEWQEKHVSDKHVSLHGQPSEDCQSHEQCHSSDKQSSLLKQQTSEDRLCSDSQRTISTRTSPKLYEILNRSQRNSTVPNYTGRPLQGSVNRRNVEKWTPPPSAVQTTFRNDTSFRRIPVWQHEHDDRLDRNYNS